MGSKFKKRLGRLSKLPAKPAESANLPASKAPDGTRGELELSDKAPPDFSRVKRKKLTNVSNPFRSQKSTKAPVEEIALPGEVGEIDGYQFRVVCERFDKDYVHGETCVEGVDDLDSDILSLLCLESVDEVPPLERWLFLDTETTGLAGGTGTLPFVLGIARWDGADWVTEQFILERPGKERGMLQVLTERLANVDILVTYNGKSYDWPLIKARCVMNRLPEPELTRHLDLLHVFRRLYGKELDDVRLTTIERERLGFERIDDLPGSQVPEVYFKYLRTGRAEKFSEVIKHNVDDLLAMVGMIAHLTSTLKSPEVSLSVWAEFALAKMHLRLNGDGEALDQLRRALGRGEVGSEAWFKSLDMASVLLKRKGAHGEALGLLEEAEKVAGRLDEASLESLAKLYEHKTKDYESALRCAAELMKQYPAQSHEHRLRRIEEKIGRG